jgi:hypothetical protein
MMKYRYNSGNFSGHFKAFFPDTEYAIRAYAIINGQTYYGKTLTYNTANRGSWRRLANFPGPFRKFPVSFTVNGKGYVGCGIGEQGNMNDMWQFDPVTESWTRVSNYPGGAMNSGFSFVIGNKAYIGGGTYETDVPFRIYGGYLKLYEYDPATDHWTKMPDISLGDYAYTPGMFGSFAFAVGGFGFVGGGAINGSDRNIGIFKFDPIAKTWESYSLLPRKYNNEIVKIHYGAAFVIGDTAFIATGFNEYGFDYSFDNFYSWNYQTKEWKLLNAYPLWRTSFALTASVGNAGYLGTGSGSNSWYQFRHTTQAFEWKPTSPVPDHYGTIGGMSFTIGNKFYMGLGEPIFAEHGGNRVYEFTHTR